MPQAKHNPAPQVAADRSGEYTAAWLSKLRRIMEPVREFTQRWRTTILIIAAIAFLAGFAWSASTLDLTWADVSFGPLALLILGVAPISIAYSAVNLQLMGNAINANIGFRRGVQVSAYAQVAELLPIPGGAIVRTAALMKEGGRAGQSAGLVFAFALLWIACAAVGGGIALLDFGLAGFSLLAGGIIAIGVITTWLARSFGWRIATIATALRIFGIMLVTVRVMAAFAVIGLTIGAVDALAFVFAIILGSAASIVPAGLGVGEGLSALMAQPTEISPAAAFLAAAVGRLAVFSVNMCTALLASAFRKQPSRPTDLTND